MTVRIARMTLALTAAAAALVAVLGLYARPQMMVVLGDMIWACFR